VYDFDCDAACVTCRRGASTAPRLLSAPEKPRIGECVQRRGGIGEQEFAHPPFYKGLIQ
jgi:hypothetical protein